MTQTPRPRKTRPTPPPNRVPAVLSALSVIILFIVLGFVLLNTRGGATPTGMEPTTLAFEDATAETDTNTNAADTNTNAADANTNVATSEPAPAETAVGLADSSGAATKQTYSALPPMTIDATQNYTATITTASGDIVIRLRPDLAPQTVNSFVFLAREGFYDGLTFHRVLPGFVAQGGDPQGDGTGGPGYTVPGEFTEEVLFDKPGIVAMARPGNDVNGNGSQFFITLAPAPNLNGQYTIFGEVVEGQDVVDQITPRDPQQNPNAPPGDKIEKITIQEG